MLSEPRLSEFEAFLGAPALRGDPDLDWTAFGQEFCIDLPRSYREFVSAYGPGCIGETLLIFHPRGAAGEGSLNLAREVNLVSAAYSELKSQSPTLYPVPIYPESYGCFPIARTSDGSQLFLKLDEDGHCSVIAHFRGPWVTWNMGFCEFLLLAIKDQLSPPFFHESVLEDIKFEPVGAVV